MKPRGNIVSSCRLFCTFTSRSRENNRLGQNRLKVIPNYILGRAYKLGGRRLNGPRHTFHYHTLMDMWLGTQGGSDLLTPEGYTNIDAFSILDETESYSPLADDPFMECAEDPPALIA